MRIGGARALTGARAVSTERVLAETEHLFAEVFHEVADGIVIASLEDRRILEVNDAYCRMFGFTPARKSLVIRRRSSGSSRASTSRMRAHASCRDERCSRRREIAITTKSGDPRTVAVSPAGDPWWRGEGADHVRDVTERVVRERALRMRAAEQRVLAELGLGALTHVPPAELIERAVRAVAARSAWRSSPSMSCWPMEICLCARRSGSGPPQSACSEAARARARRRGTRCCPRSR